MAVWRERFDVLDGLEGTENAMGASYTVLMISTMLSINLIGNHFCIYSE